MRYIFIVVVFISLFGCGQKSDKSTSVQQNKNETLKEDKAIDISWKNINKKGMSIDIPENWDLDESGKYKSLLIAYPKGEKSSVGFRDNVIVTGNKNSNGKITYDTWPGIVVKGLEKNGEYKIIKSEKFTNNGVDMYEMIIDQEYQGYELRYWKYMVLKDNRAYTVTLTSEQATYEKHLAIVQKIFDSLVIA